MNVTSESKTMCTCSVPEEPTSGSGGGVGPCIREETRVQRDLELSGPFIGIDYMWLILCISLTGLRGAQIFGETLFLDVSVRVFLGEADE